MVIHRVIHSLWINAKKPTLWGGPGAERGPIRTPQRRCVPRARAILEAVLQHFSAKHPTRTRGREGGRTSGIAGWCCRLRIYSCGSFEYFGVPVEEFNEAYLSAKSSQESQDARLPQAHEFDGRTPDRRGPPASGPQAPGSLTVAPQQTHASDRLARVREGLPAGHGLQRQALLGTRFSQRTWYSTAGPLCIPKGR